MKVQVKLFASLREGRFKEKYIDIEEGTSVNNLIDRLGVPFDEVAIIMINGRRTEASSLLKNDDILAIFPPVGGG